MYTYSLRYRLYSHVAQLFHWDLTSISAHVSLLLLKFFRLFLLHIYRAISDWLTHMSYHFIAILRTSSCVPSTSSEALSSAIAFTSSRVSLLLFTSTSSWVFVFVLRCQINLQLFHPDVHSKRVVQTSCSSKLNYIYISALLHHQLIARCMCVLSVMSSVAILISISCVFSFLYYRLISRSGFSSSFLLLVLPFEATVSSDSSNLFLFYSFAVRTVFLRFIFHFMLSNYPSIIQCWVLFTCLLNFSFHHFPQYKLVKDRTWKKFQLTCSWFKFCIKENHIIFSYWYPHLLTIVDYKIQFL